MSNAQENSELPYWLALRRAGLGSRNFALLLARFSTITNAWDASQKELTEAGLEPQFVRAVNKARSTFDAAREMQALEKAGARAYTWLDADFPASLRDIPQSPPVLFKRGNSTLDFDSAVAIVGTRGVTPYGRQVCEVFCEALARAGVAIISGLARGVDAIAHRVALECGAPTVAVLAGGIEQVYPRENMGLAERILENGALVSEYPAGIPARPDYFPRRNRILSGLARATLVIEAGEGSGALHTANWAFEQGRDVFAIPGSIFSRQSLGTNQLIRENTARLVASPEQLLEELNLLHAANQPRLLEPPVTVTMPVETKSQQKAVAAPVKPPQPQLTATGAHTREESAILAALQTGPLHVDEIVRAVALPAQAVAGTLTLLELNGSVRQVRAMVYESAGS